jgi:hypothetical protein
MSYTFLRERAVVSSAESFQEMCQYAQSKSILSADPCCSQDKQMESFRGSQYGMMCGHSMEILGEGSPILFAGDSPAKIFPPQAVLIEPESEAEKADYGGTWRVSFAKLAPDISSWRIAQLSLFEGSIEFLQIWPRWGSMRNGECLSAADVGARHERERIWIFGNRRDSNPNTQIEERRFWQGESAQPLRTLQAEWWPAQARMGRKSDGLANWMDRLAALGNGQVPAVAQLAFRKLKIHD